MSSIDSGVNSITAVVMTDYVDRFRAASLTERSRVMCARMLTLGIGFTVISASSLMDCVPGNFLEVSQRILGLFVSPLFTLFCLALFVPRSTQAGAIVGSICSLTAAAVVAYWDAIVIPVSNAGLAERFESLVGLSLPPTISFQWILPVSLLVGLACGFLTRILFRLVRFSRSQ